MHVWIRFLSAIFSSLYFFYKGRPRFWSIPHEVSYILKFMENNFRVWITIIIIVLMFYWKVTRALHITWMHMIRWKFSSFFTNFFFFLDRWGRPKQLIHMRTPPKIKYLLHQILLTYIYIYIYIASSSSVFTT